MLAPAREPRSSPCSTGFSVLSAASAFSLCSGNLRRPSPQGGSLLPRTCEPGEGWVDRSCALDPHQRQAERDGGGAPSRTRALRRTRAWVDAGVGWGPSGRGSREEDFLSTPPFGTRARASVHTRSLWSPGSVRQVRGCGTNRSVGGVPSRFQRCFPGPL